MDKMIKSLFKFFGKINLYFVGICGVALIVLCEPFRTYLHLNLQANEQANSKTVKFIFLCSRKHNSCAAWIAQFEEQMKGQRDFMHSSDVSVVVHGCPWPGILITLLFLCHSVLQLHLLSRSLATDSLACSIHYFSFVSNAAVL